MPTGEASAAARSQLLTELPHVGDEPAAMPAQAAMPPTYPHGVEPTTGAAFARPGDRPSGVAAQRPPHVHQTRYVDQAHIDHEWERDGDYMREDGLRANGPPRQSGETLIHRQPYGQRSTRRRSPLTVIFSQAHERVAPFAGLIVTGALVAAAGLLFHIISDNGASNANFNEFAVPGFRVDAVDDSLMDDAGAPLIEKSELPELTQNEEPEHETPNETAQADPAIAAPEDVLTIPAIESLAEPSAPLGQLSFPKTDSPLALDYSKAANPDLQSLPVVAERPELAPQAINR